MRQNLAPVRRNRRLHSRSRTGIDEQSHAAAPSGAANFTGQRALPSSGGNHPINHRRRNGGQIPAAEFPFLTNEPAGFLPVVSIECRKKPPRHIGDARQIAKDLLVASNVSRENFPIVYPVLLRLTRVAEHKPPLEFVQIAPDFLSPLASWLQMNRAGTPKRRRIMILRARGNANYDSFRVAADVDPIFQAQTRARQPIECRADGHSHRARTADPGSCRRLRIGRQRQPDARAEKAHQMRQQRQPITSRAFQSRQRRKAFLALCIPRDKPN